MKKNFMSEKVEKTLSWLLAIICVVGYFWIHGNMSDKLRNTAENGIDTIGVVLSRGRSGSFQPGSGSKGIRFVFYQDGYYVTTDITGIDEEGYEKAIVGMKYRVRYIPDNSQLDTVDRSGVNHWAIIDLNYPIYEEYRNIESTRKWIHKSYYSHKKKIPGARKLKDISHLIPEEFR